MNKGYQLEREYSIGEIICYNLKMWWLAVICAVVCAAALGGYKFVSLYPYIEKDNFESIQQVETSIYVKPYSNGDSLERVNNIIKISDSHTAYEMVTEQTGYELDYATYKKLFEVELEESGDVAVLSVTYPVNTGAFSLADETSAMEFANAILDATTVIAEDLIGEDAFAVLDAPHLTTELREVETYFITKDDFKKGVFKGLTAGVILGVLVEVVLYTFWMLLYKKPKNIEEIRQCLDTTIIDSLKEKNCDEEDTFKKVALFLSNEKKENKCLKITCLSAECAKKDVALKLAMSYANEQKKTLYIDLTTGKENADAANSISSYVLGAAEMPHAKTLNNYLDVVCRNVNEEKGFNVVMNERFAEYVAKMGEEYACVVVGGGDVAECADGYAAAKLCDKTFLVCGRKTVTNETLYRVKNTADVNGICIEGVLVYEL